MAEDIRAFTAGLDDSKLRRSIQDMVSNIETETNKMTKKILIYPKPHKQNVDF